MSTPFVADSSIALAWVASSQGSPDTDALFKDVGNGRPFIVPSLWTFEVANALLLLQRHNRLSASDCASARQIVSRLRPAFDDEGTYAALTVIWEIADRHELTVYDATYLELAIRKRVGLASRDRVLNKAAKLAGVKTVLEP
jgi:predicted nucleic acid-binding protein